MNSQHKVIVRLRGGLGNQISCYYAGLYLAKLNNATLILDGRFIKFGGNSNRTMEINRLDFGPSPNQVEYKATIPLPKSRIGKKLFRPALKPIADFLDKFENCSVLGDSDPLIDLKINSDVRLDGYFPSFEYYEKCRKQGLGDIPKPIRPSKDFQSVLRIMKERTSLHIRLGDYLLHPDIYSIPSESYYRKGLEITGADQIGYNVFVEDLNEAQERFPKLMDGASNIFTSGDFDTAETLCLMASSRNLVTANSSFSSWAGMYVSNHGGTVVAPDRITNEDSEDLRPANWIRVKLNS